MDRRSVIASVMAVWRAARTAGRGDATRPRGPWVARPARGLPGQKEGGTAAPYPLAEA